MTDLIKDVMTQQTHTVGANTSLTEAEAMMDRHTIRHLPVLHGGSLVGILSDRDIAASQRFDVPKRGDLPVAEACTQEVYAVAPDTPLAECVSNMAERHLGCVVVTQHNKVLGIFTTTDACRLLAQRLI